MRHGVLILLGFVFVTPFLWLISTSLKTNEQIVQASPAWIPRPATFQNYLNAFNTVPLLEYGKNTLIVTLFSVLGSPLLEHPGGLRFLSHPMAFPRVFFHHHPGDFDAPISGHHGAFVHHVLEAALDQHFPAAHRSLFFRQRILHFPVAAIFSGHPARAVGSRQDRRSIRAAGSCGISSCRSPSLHYSRWRFSSFSSLGMILSGRSFT